MKTIEPKVANQLVKTIGLKNIYDCNTTISKEDLVRGLNAIEPTLLVTLSELYKNRVKERVAKGVSTTRHLLCLVRRVLRHHNVLLNYKKKFRKRKAIFTYNLVY